MAPQGYEVFVSYRELDELEKDSAVIINE